MIISMNRNGFTVIELIIAITIMAVLIIFSFINLESSQVSARDAERATDVETLALQLDNYYKSGTDGVTAIGEYPATQEFDSVSEIKFALRDIDNKTLTAPGITDPASTIVVATNNTQTTAGVSPQPTISTYVYQPIQSDGSLCTLSSQECRKFNLYYKTEADSIVHQVTGKNQ